MDAQQRPIEVQRALAKGIGGVAAVASPAPPQRMRVHVVATHPHDRTAFTEGLVVVGGRLFESVGLERHSDVREVELRTGRVLRRTPLAADLFGEGLAALPDGSLVQLSWRNRVALRWGSTLRAEGTFAFAGEGWGLCYDPIGKRLVQSDGSSTLTFRSPISFAEIGRLAVLQDGNPVTQLNELECDGRSVLVNIWHSDQIARVSLVDGRVTAVIDASGLGPGARDSEDVLNGIAKLRNGHWLLAGKRWPLLYEVTFESS